MTMPRRKPSATRHQDLWTRSATPARPGLETLFPHEDLYQEKTGKLNPTLMFHAQPEAINRSSQQVRMAHRRKIVILGRDNCKSPTVWRIKWASWMHQKAKRWEVLQVKRKWRSLRENQKKGELKSQECQSIVMTSWTLTFVDPVKRSRARRLFMSRFEESNLWHADRQIAVTQWEVGTSRCHWKSISPHLQWAEYPWLQTSYCVPQWNQE